MKTVWAPWRMEFIGGKRERGCVFCNRARRRRDRKDLILHRGRFNFVILNRYPYNNGHLMVVPYRHMAAFEKMKKEETVEMLSLMARAIRAMRKALRPQGFNVGLNLGKAAGAGIDDHLHFHVIPRWSADTNFWPVIAATRAMPAGPFAVKNSLPSFTPPAMPLRFLASPAAAAASVVSSATIRRAAGARAVVSDVVIERTNV